MDSQEELKNIRDWYNILARKGTLELLVTLLEKGEMKWSEVKSILGNDRTLASNTKKLIDIGFIEKVSLPNRRTKYRITEYGKEVIKRLVDIDHYIRIGRFTETYYTDF